MENSKGRKLCHVQCSNGVGGNDRLSSLPDGVLHNILGYFSTDEVIRLSMLSTRWKYLWTSIPNLNFSDKWILDFEAYEDPKRVEKFQNFVDRVLRHHSTSNIHKFHLECSQLYGGSHLQTWISSLSMHKLGELLLEVDGDHFSFSNFLSISKSLTVLVLGIPTVLLVPASVCFPNLKVVTFQSVMFSRNTSTQDFSFSFPVLEKFILIRCCWLETKTVHIHAPRLKKLSLEGSNRGTVFETEVKIDATSLTSLSISQTMVHDYCLSYLPLLSEASVDVCLDSENMRLLKCFTKLNHVKKLTLSDRCIKKLFGAKILNNLQVFSSLISLAVTNTSDALNAKRLIDLLCYMPNIEHLVIELNDYDAEDNDDGDSRWLNETVPPCSLLKLKSVEIINFNGTKNELCFIAYLLVRTLEKMVISFDSRWWGYSERKYRTLTDILILPRGSAGTKIIVR